jgi:KDO2-lipid IV(A) lauroyltransferase
MAGTRKPLYHFWTPNYWYLWLFLGLLRLSCLLAYDVQLRVFKAAGRLLHRFDTKRRLTARRNIQLCFPELSVEERNALVLAHYEAIGASMVELALARWKSHEEISAMSQIEGAENLTGPLDRGDRVILLTGHFTPLELSGRVMQGICPRIDAVFQMHPNELLTEILRTTRERVAASTIESSDVRGMVRSLKSGMALWFAPDQSVRSKQSVLTTFFGEPALNNTATTKLAKLGKAVAVPWFLHRVPEGGYKLTILPQIENFPSDDPVADTKKFIAILESQIRRFPEQYIWTYRKFKGRPEPLPDPYSNLDALK